MSLPALQSDANAGTASWLNHVFVHVGGPSDGASGTGTWSYDSTGANTIKYRASDKHWLDGTSTAPDYMTSSSSYNSSTHVADPEYVFLWRNNGVFLGKFANPFYSQAGSGGGTSTEGFSYSGTLTVNGSDLEYEVPGSSTAGTYQILSKYLPSGVFQLDTSITHVEGVASTGSAVNFDSSKQWILRSPLGDVLDSAGASPVNSKVFSNFW